MRTYPIMLNVHGRLCVVIGGGAVGLRKVSSLTKAGAKVRLVDPRADASAVGAGVEVRRQKYDKMHLAGAMLVFACTDQAALNSRIAADARAVGALVNSADQPPDCDFYAPAVTGEGDIVIAIGTSGASPALAAWLKTLIGEKLPPGLADFAAALSQIRQRLQYTEPDIRRRAEILKLLSGADGYRTFTRGGAPALEELARTR
jgi:precorrin-2 dehydrogenase / sirohydrochlorin ferrochelatase